MDLEDHMSPSLRPVSTPAEKIYHAFIYSVLILSVSTLSLTSSGSFAYDRPVQSSVFALAVVGGAILVINRVIPSYYSARYRETRYSAIPLEERDRRHSSRESSAFEDAPRLESSPYRVLFTLVVIAICLRVELLRLILRDIQCSQPGVEAILPLFLAFVHFWRDKGSRPKYITNHTTAFPHFIASSRWRYLVPTLCISFGGVLLAHETSAPRSTFICARTLAHSRSVPIYQYIGVLLDCFILAGMGELLGSGTLDDSRGASRRSVFLGWIFLMAATSLLVKDFAMTLTVPEYRHSIIPFSMVYLKSLVVQIFLFTLAVHSALKALHNLELITLSVVVQFLATYFTDLAAAWADRPASPLVARGNTFFALCLLFLGMVILTSIESNSENPQSPIRSAKRTFFHLSSWIYGFLFVLFLLRISAELNGSKTLASHPLDFLIHNAAVLHNKWVKQASASSNLVDAVAEYRRRYNRDPPPGFDEWYNYATSRASLIIDDYDTIHDDLLLFWSLSPLELRRRTRQMTSNTRNDISLISIRNGTAEISSEVLPTHRWMLEGVVAMISKFTPLLPDMDVAFNMNDEPRVNVPWEQANDMMMVRTASGNLASGKGSPWSADRAKGWETISKELTSDTNFEQRSFRNTFYDYGAEACPPDSRARRERIWDTRNMCVSCAAPHSFRQFVRNWTLAADICHQPDMANLHGLYISPSSFKGTHELMPVFSQSKAYGYRDILYPSAWNYMDKIRYDPTDVNPDVPYKEKANSLFWRGATSEGFSIKEKWQGMSRQRFVHLANNASHSVPILLPHPSNPSAYSYENVPVTNLRNLMKMDVGIVDSIARCDGRDCHDQEMEFSLTGPVDFQHHWMYRYLFDVDGAGFSGRFLPFLQSRSLPFKTALFRTWMDARLTPWLHFVPQDLRLHELFSTLAYFAGVEGNLGNGKGRRVFMKAHETEGDLIAEQGRKWSGMVLRKEDMEIYFFRLLLEWGRLTDDRRDEIGFRV